MGTQRGVYLNPGSAGPRRFRLPVTLALVTGGRTLESGNRRTFQVIPMTTKAVVLGYAIPKICKFNELKALAASLFGKKNAAFL